MRGTDSDFRVDARDVHARLGVSTAFNVWITRRIADFGFLTGQDFHAFLRESSGGRPSKEYTLTMDMAKHLAMVDRSKTGMELRNYFIASEKELQRRRKNEVSRPPTRPEALRGWADAMEANGRLTVQNAELLTNNAELEEMTEELQEAVAFTKAERDNMTRIGAGRRHVWSRPEPLWTAEFPICEPPYWRLVRPVVRFPVTSCHTDASAGFLDQSGPGERLGIVLFNWHGEGWRSGAYFFKLGGGTGTGTVHFPVAVLVPITRPDASRWVLVADPWLPLVDGRR